MSKTDWWASFYRDLDLDRLMVRKDEPALRFLTQTLRLKPGRTVFDQCCGVGSLSLPLAERGARVIGVDLCLPYIRRARRSAKTQGLSCEFHRGDAFKFVPEPPCDAAFNWYTSFGYAREDERNLRMLRRAFESLRPGGRFALDYPNIPFLLRNFKEKMRQGDIIRECALDLRAGMLEQKWTAGAKTRRSALRLYMPHELAGMLRRCGFGAIELFGGLKSERLALESLRCICVASKPL